MQPSLLQAFFETRFFRCRPRAEILPSITRPGISAERARVSKRRAARLQTGIPKIPRLDHMRPDLRRNRDIGCACRSGIEKAFGGPTWISIGGSPLKSA